ncbi:MAG: HAD family hydrolase [Acidobacteria bacterium]|nr:HAD family hydrolase [Acidobacteriota bacterium]
MPRLASLPRAVLVDLDDTIVDDSGAVVDCWEDACESCTPLVEPRAVLTEIHAIRDWFWSDPDRHRHGRLDLTVARRQIAKMALLRIGHVDDRLAARIAERYSQCRQSRMVLLPGAVDALTWLRESGCQLALLTNGAGSAQRQKIVRFQLEPLFDLILVEGELGFGKPDARIYQLALTALAAAPRDTWMIGDNLEWDVGQPQRLGVAGIWVDTAGSGLPASCAVCPDLIVGGLGELRERIGGPGSAVRA